MASSPAQPVNLLDKPVRDCPDLVHLAPPLVQPESTLNDIVAALSSDPSARVVFVGDAQDRLIGWIPERALDMGLLLAALPGELWRSVGELDMRELLRAAHGKGQTARELMSPARTVTAGTALKEAVIAMARHSQQVVALVDDQQRLLGYLTLFEVLAALSQ
ncbi:MAG: CBS domain-containing protein [Chloroflexota bacterium]|nr:CBS domain-containing protein [Chloroflexota bacterium]